ncbi:MAG: DUF2683 family protein [Nanoarchaeota archaeon]|nr:DUF2683 family protein [Nanoarchaeota archaeon]
MVQSIIDLGEKEDRILNIVKAMYGLKNKSQAVAFIAGKYEDAFLEPELNPEFVVKLNEIKKEKGLKFNSVSDLRKHIEKNA